MFKSIFQRLFWTNAAVLVCVLLTVCAAMSVFVVKYTDDNQVKSAQKACPRVENIVNSMVENADNNNIMLICIDELSAWADMVGADIIAVNADGDTLATTCSVNTVPQEYIERVISGESVKTFGRFANAYNSRVMTVGLPITLTDGKTGAVFFNTYFSNSMKVIKDILYMFLISVSATMIIAFVFIYYQSKRISQPIKKLNTAAMDIAAGRFDKRMMISTSDEMGQLAASFNVMADSLERLEDMRSSFVSDVSHELRTPMTSISGFIQGILDHTIPPEKEREYLSIVLDETKRLTRLVNDMLETSKISSLQYNLDMVEFDITEMVRRAVIQLETKISDKDLELEIDFEDEVIRVIADEDAIRRVILNILDNAVKFSYKGTKTDIRIRTEGGKVITSIGNHGMGIEGAELRTVFDRFYKTDKSRSKDKQGAGLGLYLVKNILQCHKQDIWVESVDVPGQNMKYTRFTFTLEKA